MILVPLFDLKFLNERARGWCRNFKSAALDGTTALVNLNPGTSLPGTLIALS